MTQRLRAAARQRFDALAVRNFRLFVIGQVISISGSWMQLVAQDWLVLQLTDSGLALGLVTACQFLPMLLIGPFAGVVADRVDKRRILQITQATSASAALILGVLTVTGLVQLWMVFILALALGTSQAFDMPSRQAFVFEMVGPERLTNAVGLTAVIMNSGRLVGPALAGVVIGVFGMGPCFFLNAASFLGTFVALGLMRRSELHPATRAARAKGQLREGLRYVWGEPALRTPLLMVAVLGMFAYEWQVSFPLLVRYTFGGGADAYGLLLSSMGLGAVVSGLVLATRVRSSHRNLGWSAVVLGATMLVAAAMPTLGATAVVVGVVGGASVLVVTLANTTLQLSAAPHMRARVMALYSVAFIGTTPFGGPVIGWVGEAVGGRAPLALGGLVAVAAAALAWRSLRRAADGGLAATPGSAPPRGQEPAPPVPAVEAA